MNFILIKQNEQDRTIDMVLFYLGKFWKQNNTLNDILSDLEKWQFYMIQPNMKGNKSREKAKEWLL